MLRRSSARLGARALRRVAATGRLPRQAHAHAHAHAHARGTLHLDTLHMQSRSMGFFSDIKKQFQAEVEKNEELKKSLEELEKTKEQIKNVEKAAKEKMQEVSSMTGEAAKNVQEQASAASQKFKESYEATTKANKTETDEGDATRASQAGEGQEEQSQKDGEKVDGKTDDKASAEESELGQARAFVNKMFARITEQKNKILKPGTLPKVKEEWRDAARELFGSKEARSVDEALASVRTPTMTKPDPRADGEEEEEYTGSSALVAVKEDETAWQKVSARFREAPIIQGILDAAKQAARTEAGKKFSHTAKKAKDRIGDVREDAQEFWETSQNPWVYRLSSIYDGLFGETPMAIAIREIRRAEPDFILEEWKDRIEEVVLPGVLEAFLRGNSRDLKKWFGEAAYSRINAAIRERKTDGLVMDPNVLSIDNVDVIEATAEDKQAPIILVRFQAQQINCIRNREGEVVDGAEDEVLAYFYMLAFQRDYDDEQEALRWRIVDLYMQRGGRYY